MKIKAFILLLFLIQTLSAQEKRSMTVDDMISWKTIDKKAISNNGKWVAYVVNPGKGDGSLYLYNDSTKQTKVFERGAQFDFGPQNNYLLFTIKPQSDTLHAQKLKKLKKDEQSKDSLGIYFFDKDSLIKFPKYKSFDVPQKEGVWLSFTYEFKMPKDTTKLKNDSLKTDTLEIKPEKTKTKKKNKKQDGHRCVLLHSGSLDTLNFENISDVICSEGGQSFFLYRQIKDSLDTAQVIYFDAKTRVSKTIFSQGGKIAALSTNRLGTQLAFVHSKDTGEVKNYDLWQYATSKDNAVPLIDSMYTNLPKGFRISAEYTPKFSDSGRRLYLGIAPQQFKLPKDSLTDDEKVKLDIWAWTDRRMQPQQLLSLDKDKKKSYLSVFDFKLNRLSVLEDSVWSSRINTQVDPDFYWLYSDFEYQKMQTWTDDSPSDYMMFDYKKNQRFSVAQSKLWQANVSPSGRFVALWDYTQQAWFLYDAANKGMVQLSNNQIDQFSELLHDTPSLRPSNGLMGWTKAEKEVLIFSDLNIWSFTTQSKPIAKNLTESKALQYRYQKINSDDVYLPDVCLLNTFNPKTMNEGFARYQFSNGQLNQLLDTNFAFIPVIASDNRQKYLWSQSSFTHYPELCLSDSNFLNSSVISHVNELQDSLLWGQIHLLDWTDFNGDTLRGLLVLPENLDSTKKYPVIVYFYEKSSNNLHMYWHPRPSRSIINWPYFTSNDYIVFVPDIHYQTGQPGKDAYNAIMSGTKFIAQMPFVDHQKMGLQGQSWGGYQVAYLITQTNWFACAMAGAAVSNMTSAYGGIRWGAGVSRTFQYETGQSRIGQDLWSARDKYIENSPLFFADKIRTPLLMMNNDNDGAVPWTQGIEFFNALRRLQQPVWMLNYNGDDHNLLQWPNRVDLTLRMNAFFDHYLKGTPMPEWMEKGRPALQKDKTMAY